MSSPRSMSLLALLLAGCWLMSASGSPAAQRLKLWWPQALRRSYESSMEPRRPRPSALANFGPRIQAVNWQPLGATWSSSSSNDSFGLAKRGTESPLVPVGELVLANGQSGGDCRTLTSEVLVTRDEADPLSGRPARQCRATVQLNRCEGSCVSRVEPTAKWPPGLKMECSCCDEGAMRRRLVQLTDCYSLELGGGLANGLVLGIESLMSQPMEVAIEEPIDCRCRRCEPLAS